VSSRPSDQIWSRLFSDPSGVRAFPEARRIPLDLIDANPDQPRAALGDVDELADQIQEYGLLQPVVVSEPVDGRYVLIAGHRRVAAIGRLRERAATPQDAARWADIPAVVRSVGAADRLVLALAENVSRSDLTDAEIVTATRLLRDLHQWSQSEIARRLGVSRQWISQYFQAIEDPELAQRIQAGELSTAKAYEVRRARTPRAKRDALDAALAGAPLREVRRLATGSPTAPGSTVSSDLMAPPPFTAAPTAPELSAAFPPAASRLDGAIEIDLRALKTTELIRTCVARGIRRVRLDTLLRSLEEDLRLLRDRQPTS